VIIPIWHGVTVDEVRAFSLPLSDKLAVRSDSPVWSLAEAVLRVVHQGRAHDRHWVPPSIPVPDGSTLVLFPMRQKSGLSIGMFKQPVTNSQYSRFLAETGHREPLGETWSGSGWVGPFQPLDHAEFQPARSASGLHRLSGLSHLGLPTEVPPARPSRAPPPASDSPTTASMRRDACLERRAPTRPLRPSVRVRTRVRA
jgi:hypothetical protein